MAFHTAAANEYLVVTGAGIKDVKLKKKGWIYPGQKFSRFDISPANYKFDVHAMSSEKLPFILPAVFTIGPKDDSESLMKYGKLMSSHDKSGNHVVELVKGIVEGETRVLAAGMTMEDIFRGTKQFKAEVFDKVPESFIPNTFLRACSFHDPFHMKTKRERCRLPWSCWTCNLSLVSHSCMWLYRLYANVQDAQF